MAYLRKDVGAVGGDDTPGDYHERIRLIADVCENLPGHLRARTCGTPFEGPQYAWDKADEPQRRRLRATLTQHRIVISEIIAGASSVSRHCARPPTSRSRYGTDGLP